MGTIRILLVDDQPDIRLLWRMQIQRANDGLHVVGEFASALEALEALDDTEVDVFVIDHMMPGMTGIELVRELRARGDRRPIILCSAYLGEEVEAAAVAAGVDLCLPKGELKALPDHIRVLATAA